MIARQVALLQKRLERAEATIKRITQIETKPRLIIPVGGGGSNILGYCTFIEDYTLVAGACPITQPPPRSGLFLITEPPCDDMSLGGEELVIYDPLGCILDLDEADLVGVRFEFGRGTIENPFFDTTPGPCYDPAPYICEYTLIDRCCTAADSGGGGAGLGLIPGLGV